MRQEQNMRHGKALGLALIAGSFDLAHQASAQLALGPIPYQQNVNGVNVTVNVTSLITVQTNPGSLLVTAKVNGDLFDLQQKIGAIVDRFNLPTGNCDNKGIGKINPVVSITSKSLAAEGEQAVFAIGGHIDVWTCVDGPPNSEVQWQMKKIGPIKTKVPVIHTWPSVIKNKDATQPFDATIPVSFVKQSDTTVALQLGQPNIKLSGQYAFITDGILKIANIDINQKAVSALQGAIDPNKLKATLPTELQKLNMAVQSAHFVDDGGHLVAELNLSSNVSAAAITNLLKQIQLPSSAAPGTH
jgi:hypothetical protein